MRPRLALAGVAQDVIIIDELDGEPVIGPRAAAIRQGAGPVEGDCGRARAVYRKFGICRICFRNLASGGMIPGVKKASW